MSKLAANEIHLTLKGRKVLENISLELGTGLVGLVGPNGAGKSSLLRIMAGIWSSDMGSVVLNGTPLYSLEAPERARQLAFLPPERDMHWPLPVSHVVSLGRVPHRGPFAPWSAEDEAAVVAALKSVDADHLSDRPVSELSNGERARVLLARALAVDAPILLVDEAIAALDPAHQLQVMEVLRGEADKGRLVLAVLHDLGLARRYCDEVVLMNQGTIHDRGPAEKVLSAKNMGDVYGIEVEMGMAQGQPYIIPTRQIKE